MHQEGRERKEILVAIIGGIALIISALITGFFSSQPTRMAIQATLTAEANTSLTISTQTPQFLSTPIKETTLNQITPTSPASIQQAPLSSIPVRKNELLLAISGVLLLVSLIGIFLYISSRIPYKYETLIFQIMVTVAIVAPFILVWVSYFFSFPQNIPFALVLFIALLSFAIYLWFPYFFNHNLHPLWVILILTSPVYITAFGFTNMSLSEAFITASKIIGVEVLYLLVLIMLTNLSRRRKSKTQ